uniref:Glycosyltransferase n=1 Tax=Panax notoginseng TaxID=44586 RepID=A0A977R8Y5_9APIA|nr:UGT35 [Panax notoginseng]
MSLHSFKNPGEKYPFLDFNENSNITPEPPSADNMKLFLDFMTCFERSCDIILIKSFRELEGKYFDFFSTLSDKTVVPVGPLVQDPMGHNEDPKTEQFINWLDKRAESTVVFVCFGSEYFLSNEELEEVAIGLEISMVNFIWAVRFLEGEKKGVLPEGFVQRVGDRGLVVEGWAPQARILGHSSTGGFVSHCGWSSITESMKFGVPVIAMARHFDQPLNGKLAAEVGVGMEVVRDENGKYKREGIAEVTRKVVVEKSGEVIRRKARELSEKMKEKGEQEIDRVVEELVIIAEQQSEAPINVKSNTENPIHIDEEELNEGEIEQLDAEFSAGDLDASILDMSFDRLWVILILVFQAAMILAWQETDLPWQSLDNRDVQVELLTVFITWAGLRVIQSVLDAGTQYSLVRENRWFLVRMVLKSGQMRQMRKVGTEMKKKLR